MPKSRPDRLLIVFPDPLRNRVGGMAIYKLLQLEDHPERDVQIDPTNINPSEIGQYAELFSVGIHEEVVNLRKSLSEITAERNQLNITRENLEKAIADQKDNSVSLVELLEKKTQEILTLAKLNEKKQQALTECKLTISELYDTVNKLTYDNTTLVDQLAKQSNTNDNLDKQVFDLNNAVTQLKEQFASFKSQPPI
jgi:chromosome segregation ATPase